MIFRHKARNNGALCFFAAREVYTMLKACSKCGKIHERSYICTPAIMQQRNSEADKFRNTQTWRRKSESIKKRDRYFCRVCLEKLYNTRLRYNGERLSVQHIIPLAEDFGRRLDDSNLITLCAYHHELAERGTIPRRELLALAQKPTDLA